jgi:hypothetical protein
MPTLIENLNLIDSIKTDIKSAIQNKGVDMTGMSFQDYPAAIGSITTTFVTETLSVSENGTYNPGEGVDGFSQVVVSVPQSVQGYTLEQIVNGDLPGATAINSTITEFMTGGCWGNVETVNLPNCYYITDMAFWYCQSLRAVSAPVCEEIGHYAFANCNSLSELNMPALTYVPEAGFGGCATLHSISFPYVEEVGAQAFALDFGLSEVYLPICTSIASSAFLRCSAISSLTVTAVRSIGDDAFRQCNGLTEVNLPNCASISGYAFAFCNYLVSVSLPRVANMQNQVFYGCQRFSQLTIGTDWYMIPMYMGTLDATAFASGTGSIYVDATMYDKWVASQGWSSFASLFVSVGDSTVPMVSLSDGVFYGKTKIMGDQYTMQQAMNINPNQINVVSLASCQEVQRYAFQMNNNITAVDLPVCTTIQSGAFINCGNISTVSLPMCETLDYGALARTGITTISLPACKGLENAVFEMCSGLTEVYLGSECAYIGDFNFNYLPNLSNLTVAYSGVCQLGTQMNRFLSTTSIYVPASLVNAYKVANVWKQYSSQIFSIQ